MLLQHSTKDPYPTTLVNLDTGACSAGGPIYKLSVPWGKDQGHFNLYSLAKTPIKYDNFIRMLGRPFIFVVLSLIVNARGEESCRPAIICCEESLRRCGGGCDCILFSRRMTRERVLRVQFAPGTHLVYADRVLVEAVGDPVPRISKISLSLSFSLSLYLFFSIFYLQSTHRKSLLTVQWFSPPFLAFFKILNVIIKTRYVFLIIRSQRPFRKLWIRVCITLCL